MAWQRSCSAACDHFVARNGPVMGPQWARNGHAMGLAMGSRWACEGVSSWPAMSSAMGYRVGSVCCAEPFLQWACNGSAMGSTHASQNRLGTLHKPIAGLPKSHADPLQAHCRPIAGIAPREQTPIPVTHCRPHSKPIGAPLQAHCKPIASP
jgi:hypothetical protein